MIDITEVIQKSIQSKNIHYETLILNILNKLPAGYAVDWDRDDGEMWGSLVLKSEGINKRLALFRANFPLVIALNEADTLVESIFEKSAVIFYVENWDKVAFTVKRNDCNAKHIEINECLDLQTFSMNDFWFHSI